MIWGCVLETYFAVSKCAIIRLFEILKMLYPPKEAAKAVPEWGPIDFTYVLFFGVVF